MKQVFLYFIFLMVSIQDYAYAKAFYCTNCSTNLVQALDRVTNSEQLISLLKQYDEAVQQTAHQLQMVQQNIEQYANMIKNTAQLPLELVNEVRNRFVQLANLTNQLKTLRGDIVSLGSIFTELYPEKSLFSDIASASPERIASAISQYQHTWDRWADNVDRAAQAAFQISGSQLEALQQDAAKFQNYLDRLLSTPDGQMKAIMAGNQLATLQIQESRQLRELMATQVQNTITTQMKQEKESQMEEEAWRDATKLDGLENLQSKDDPF